MPVPLIMLLVKKEPKQTISIEEDGKVAEISAESKKGSVVKDLGNLIESYKSGNISKKSLKKKTEILSE